MNRYTIDTLCEWSTHKEVRRENMTVWIKCRPDNWKYESFTSKLKQAWGVLTGKYDVIDWGDQNEP